MIPHGGRGHNSDKEPVGLFPEKLELSAIAGKLSSLRLRVKVREGAMTIRVELGNDERFKGLHLPSRSRIAAYLHQEGLTRTPQGQFSLGCRRYSVGVEFENQMLEITFDPQTCELVCLTENGRREIRLAAQGLTKSDLMGELHRLTTQSPYQLVLSFSRTERR